MIINLTHEKAIDFNKMKSIVEKRIGEKIDIVVSYNVSNGIYNVEYRKLNGSIEIERNIAIN